MRSNHSVGRHRRPGPARALATRTAVSTGAAVAAVLMAGGPATAATASTDAAAVSAPTAAQSAPTAEPPCTGTPLDAIVGPAAGVDCNSNPADDDPTNPGGPATPDDSGGNPPEGQVFPALAAAAPAAEPPCTGTALDAIIGPAAGVDCNSNPADNDPTDPGGPNTPDDGGGNPPAGGGTPGAPPISCTGSPLDAFTTCATGGHSQRGGDRGDAVGDDTPSYGSGGNDQGENPPAG